eukprot:COSAG06_NODE_23386_length_693_cov_1.062290_2_plen_172_part_01
MQRGRSSLCPNLLLDLLLTDRGRLILIYYDVALRASLFFSSCDAAVAAAAAAAASGSGSRRCPHSAALLQSLLQSLPVPIPRRDDRSSRRLCFGAGLHDPTSRCGVGYTPTQRTAERASMKVDTAFDAAVVEHVRTAKLHSCRPTVLLPSQADCADCIALVTSFRCRVRSAA